jgi:thymidylate synthase (FAD)
VSFAKETGWEVDSEAIQRMKDSGSPTIPLQELKKLGDKDKKLIKYLAKHNHWTPFAHPQITLRIKAPISVRTQFFKHKQGFVENEISRRYVSYTPEFYYPQWRGKPTNGAKQGSEDFIQLSVMDEKKYLDAVQSCVDSYDRLLEAGVAPEQARFILPQGMYTEWYWTGSLAAYARFYKQRIDEHAQWEIRQYAEAVGKIISPLFPESWKELTQCH